MSSPVLSLQEWFPDWTLPARVPSFILLLLDPYIHAFVHLFLCPPILLALVPAALSSSLHEVLFWQSVYNTNIALYCLPVSLSMV